MALDSYDVLGIKISAVNQAQAVAFIDEIIQTRQKTYVCVAPVATVVDSIDNEEYRQIVNQAGMRTPDGMPIVWLGKMQGKAVERTYGPDLMLNVCENGLKSHYRHYFYGGTPEILELLILRLKERFKGITIVGHYAPDFLKVGEQEKGEVIEKINQCQPDIIWVGLGSPKQDYWMANHRSQLKVPVMVGVGAAFDFHAGVKKQAPIWMQKSGLEWFFRLCSEPTRLWRRYVIGNFRFIGAIIMDFIKTKK